MLIKDICAGGIAIQGQALAAGLGQIMPQHGDGIDIPFPWEHRAEPLAGLGGGPPGRARIAQGQIGGAQGSAGIIHGFCRRGERDARIVNGVAVEKQAIAHDVIVPIIAPITAKLRW